MDAKKFNIYQCVIMQMADEESTGSVGFGIIATIASLAVMGYFPLIGWIIPGIFGGLIARGKLRGLVSALIGAGVVITIAIEFALYIIPNASFVTLLTTYTGNSLVTRGVLAESGYVRGMLTANLYNFMGKAIADGLVIPGIGGFIGGAILGRKKSGEEF